MKLPKRWGGFVGWRGDIETGVGPNIRNKTMMHALNTVVSLLFYRKIPRLNKFNCILLSCNHFKNFLANLDQTKEHGLLSWSFASGEDLPLSSQ